MKGFIIWFWGLLPGLVGGYLLRTIWSKIGRKQCRFVREDRGSFSACPGLSSTACVERLCPTHCKEVHAGKCTNQLFEK